MSSDFYMLLPSNCISPEHDNNTLSDYTITLPTHLSLGNKQWSVALCEINYPHTWYNLEESDSWIDVIRGNRIRETFKIENGYYANGTELVKSLNSLLDKLEMSSAFRYSKHSNIVRVYIDPDENIFLTPKLGAMLGFSIHQFVYELMEGTPDNIKRLRATQGVDLNLNMHNLFVYTNIVRYTLVGNMYMPLLRTVATSEGNRGKYVCVNYTSPHYVPLSSNYIKQINITIKDDQGENVKFRSGKLTVKLHFKPLSSENEQASGNSNQS